MGSDKMHLRELANVILRPLSNIVGRLWQLGRVEKKKKPGITLIFKEGVMQEAKGQSALC